MIKKKSQTSSEKSGKKKKVNGKHKGSAGERELAEYLRQHRILCRRAVQYCGKVGSAADVITTNAATLHIECKRTEALRYYEALAQAVRDAKGEKLPAVFHRKNNQEWITFLRASDFIRLLKLAGLVKPVTDEELQEYADTNNLRRLDGPTVKRGRKTSAADSAKRSEE